MPYALAAALRAEIEKVTIFAVASCVHGVAPEIVARALGEDGLPITARDVEFLVERDARALVPLINAMWTEVRASSHVCATILTETEQTDQVDDRNLPWLFVSPDGHAMCSSDPDRVGWMLADYRGYLFVNDLATREQLAEPRVQCWFELRRRLLAALATAPQHARAGLGRVALVMALVDDRAQMARAIEELLSWCDELRAHAGLERPALAEVLAFVVDQRESLLLASSDPRVDLDGARVAVGPRFASLVTQRGFGTLLASCTLHGLSSETYIRDLLFLLPRWPAYAVLELAPASWRTTALSPRARAILGDAGWA